MRGEPISGPTVLYQGRAVILGETRFQLAEAGFRRENVADVWPNIAISRLPVGIHAADVEPVGGDANTAILFSVGRPYRRISIAGRGTWTEWTEVRPDVLAEMALEYESAPEPERMIPFRLGRAPVPNLAYLAHRRIRMRLQRHDVGDSLALEESALAIARDVLAAGFAASGVKRRVPRPERERAGQSAVFDVQALLNQRLDQPLGLQDVSDAVGVSPYHLCRVFKERTGVPIHRYRDWLRLRASLERIAGTSTTLLEIALDLGYSSEAHFSDAFLRAFGMRPGAFRRRATTELLRHARR